MEQAQLKEFAEYLNYTVRKVFFANFNTVRIWDGKGGLVEVPWNEFLDMLEDKMLADLRKNSQWQFQLQIECFVTGGFCCRVVNVPDKKVLVCGDNGKTKNEARLSTVVNYLKVNNAKS